MNNGNIIKCSIHCFKRSDHDSFNENCNFGYNVHYESIQPSLSIPQHFNIVDIVRASDFALALLV